MSFLEFLKKTIVQKETSSDADKRLEKGWALYKEKKYKDAAKELKKALVGSSQPALVHFRLGFTYRLLQKSDRALDHFSRAVAIAPDEAHYHREVGRQVAYNGDRRGALNHFAASLELEPMDPLTYHETAACLGSLGYLDFAMICYTVCGVLCDIAPADYDTGISFSLFEKSVLQLRDFLGPARFLQLRSSVHERLGIEDRDQKTFTVPISRFRMVADDLAGKLREISRT